MYTDGPNKTVLATYRAYKWFSVHLIYSTTVQLAFVIIFGIFLFTLRNKNTTFSLLCILSHRIFAQTYANPIKENSSTYHKTERQST